MNTRPNKPFSQRDFRMVKGSKPPVFLEVREDANDDPEHYSPKYTRWSYGVWGPTGDCGDELKPGVELVEVNRKSDLKALADHLAMLESAMASQNALYAAMKGRA